MRTSEESKPTAISAGYRMENLAERSDFAPTVTRKVSDEPGWAADFNPQTITDIIGHWAEATPDAPALLGDAQAPLSYAGLAEVMASIQGALNGWGYGRHDRIALVHSGGAEMAAAVAGICGCATAVPLNPDNPIGEFTLILRDARVKALAVEAGLDTAARGAAVHLELPVIEIEPVDPAAAGRIVLRGGKDAKRGAGPAEPGPALADDVAVLLETSGSSGHAKLVPIRHRQASARGRSITAYLALTPADRCLSAMPLFHVGGVSATLWACFYSGSSAAPVTRMEIDLLFGALATLQPTYIAGGYTIFHAIHAQAERFGQVLTQARPPLRMLRTGAGRLDPTIAGDLEAMFDVPVIQAYGSTETGFVACDPSLPAIRKPGSVGLTGAIEVAIMSAEGRKLATGEQGEVMVRGDAVTDGYDNDAAANDIAFRDDWFRTGDEGHLDDDGYLFLTGRIKDMINRGGQKVPPAEVDDALMAHPHIATAAAFPIPHATLGEEVAAAVVLDKGATLTADTLKDFLAQHLTPYKIPRRIVFVDALPKTASGKIRRTGLAAELGLDGSPGLAVQQSSATTADDNNRPPSLLEAQLQEVWAAALGRESVGLHDDYFDLGGDSLQAVELFLRIEEVLDRHLPRSVLIEAGTVAEMARRIESAPAPSCLVPIQPKGDGAPFFCIHDIIGEVVSLRELARHIGEVRPFYGIRSVGPDGGEGQFADMETMAAYYVGEIRKLQPAGPYYLGGHSFGGRVAFEMAQQLQAAGEEVALLALIDTFSGVGSRHVAMPQRLARHRQAMAGLPLSERSAYVLLRARKITARAERSLSRRFLPATGWLKRRDARVSSIRGSRDALEEISSAYQLKPYRGDAVLFKADLVAGRHTDSHDGWQGLIEGDLQVIPITGGHLDILREPHVRGLASKLAECLRE